MFKKYGNVFFLFLCLWVFLTGAAHAGQWAKAYGGSDTEVGVIAPIPGGGGYYLYGNKNPSTSGEDALFAKLDSTGKVVWAKDIGGSQKDDLIVSPVSDGFLVTGMTKSFPVPGVTKSNILWAKFDTSWNQLYGFVFGDAAKDESGTFLKTSDGGFLFVGTRLTYGATPSLNDKDILLIKINSTGGIQWKKVLNYWYNDVGGQAVEVSDGYVVSGMLQDPVLQTWGILVMKFSKAGALLWKNMYSIDISQSLNRIGVGGGIRKLSGGNFLIVGLMQELNSLFGGSSTLLAKINSTGGIFWENTYGNSTAQSVQTFNVIENATAQTLLVSGPLVDSSTYNSSIVVMKLDSGSGYILKQNQLGLSTENNTGAVVQTGTTLYFSGVHSSDTTSSNFKTLYGLLDPSTFNPVWAKAFGGAAMDMGTAFKTAGGYMLGGTTYSFGYNPSKGNIFGMILDSNGDYPGCYIDSLNMQTINPGIVATPVNLIMSTPTLTGKTSGVASGIALSALDTPLPVTRICQPITTAAPETDLSATEEMAPVFSPGEEGVTPDAETEQQ